MLLLWCYMAVLSRAKQAMCGGGGGTALRTHNLCARRGRLVSATPPLLYPPKNYRVPTAQGAGLASRPVWIFSEIYRPYRASNPDRPVRSESLYWLSYPGRRFYLGLGKMLEWFLLF